MGSPSELVSFLQLQITHIHLYDADPDILKALSKIKIRVVISVPDNQILGIGSSNTTAATWIGRNVADYYPETLITAIAMGDEVLTTIPSSSPVLMPAIKSLYGALVAANLREVGVEEEIGGAESGAPAWWCWPEGMMNSKFWVFWPKYPDSFTD